MVLTVLNSPLELPPHYDPAKAADIWRVPYLQRAQEAVMWAKKNDILPAALDKQRIALMLVDVQNTFCLPEFELFVGGRSGTGAMDDNRRLCEFIYRNMRSITKIIATLDTHQAVQIFHAIYLINDMGEHPAPMTMISYDDVMQGKWKFNSNLADSLGIKPEDGQRHLLYYVQSLKNKGKYDLTIWPYHAMLGGIGHALVASVEEALFFHTIARNKQVDFEIKGENPQTEHYSVIRPEIMHGADGRLLGRHNSKFLRVVEEYDALIIAGQAKSHCVAWTVEDLLEDINAHNPNLAKKVYLLEDCMSVVVIPGVVDYTEQAEAAFQRFAEAGMHRIISTEPMANWH
ncbi:MAG: isochorismatase [Chloroflexi bacterium]|nr:isochorismatase [Chloroflexota bacterium]